MLRETIQWLTFRNDNKKETKRNVYGVPRSGQQTAASRRIQCNNNRCFCKHKEIDQLHYREPFEEVLRSVLCFRSYHLLFWRRQRVPVVCAFFSWKSPIHVSKWSIVFLSSLQNKVHYFFTLNAIVYILGGRWKIIISWLSKCIACCCFFLQILNNCIIMGNF